MPRKLTPAKTKQPLSPPRELARRTVALLNAGQYANKFVDDYANHFHRPDASAHPARRAELEAILEREILLAMAARIAILAEERNARGHARKRSIGRQTFDPAKFLSDFLAALSRESEWTAGDAMEFRGDLDIYRRLAAANSSRTNPNRIRSSSGGPFVDRCAILLDPSMIENATRAAGKLLPQVESLAEKLFDEVI